MKKFIPIICIILSLCIALTACAFSQQEQNEETTTQRPAETTTEEPETKPEADKTKAYIYELNPDFTPLDYSSPAILPLTEPAGEDYKNSIVFICDSPTYWMGPWEIVDSTQIWTGPEGTQTLAYQSTYEILDPYDKVERPIREVVRLHKPERIIIAVGINGISFMDEEYFTAEYEDLVTDIKEISPETDVICQSIYPINKNYRHWGNITNVMITEANSWILNVAERTGCRYLDTFSVLIGDDGMANDELMKSDGLHPNYDGLQLVMSYILAHANIG